MKNATAMLEAQINEAPRWFQLFSVQYIHPAHSFSLAYLAEVLLSGLEILVPQQHFRDDLERNPVPTGVGSRVPSQVVRPYLGCRSSPSFLIQERAVE